MLNISKLYLSFILSAAFIFSASVSPVSAAGFINPVIRANSGDCQENNLQSDHFDSEMNLEKRLKVCAALDKIANKLNVTAWSPAVAAELEGIWQVFSTETVTLRLMPKNTSSRMLAMAEAFPSGVTSSKFEACIYIRPEKSGSDSFFQLLLHELRHVYDFYHTWKDKSAMDSLEVERRAFQLMGKLSQESGKNASGVPKFWKESWRKLPANESAFKSAAAVDKYLHGSSFYRQLMSNHSSRTLDFSFQKSPEQIESRQFSNVSPLAAQDTLPKDSVRLPNRLPLPETSASLPQKIQQLDLSLERPANPRDEKEILRAALRNEKKLYYGMSNYVYDQKLQFQCWQKGKISATLSESNTVTRTSNGNAMLQPSTAAAADKDSSCTQESRNFKTDFKETFWASPALEKMPISFVGFVEVDGKTLARYTVLQPSERLFSELAAQYQSIRDFHVFIGTIFVSPEDGQIVRFWGTSFPEVTTASSTGNSKKTWGSYSVTAVRQKLNINHGLWVTVYVGAVGMAQIKGNSCPLSYTVKFENYRQSTTEVRIIDDEVTAVNSLVSSK